MNPVNLSNNSNSVFLPLEALVYSVSKAPHISMAAPKAALLLLTLAVAYSMMLAS